MQPIKLYFYIMQPIPFGYDFTFMYSVDLALSLPVALVSMYFVCISGEKKPLTQLHLLVNSFFFGILS